jgi:DNA polymerase I-like protein with 3'-5' exonuclease and polymerase domains
MLHTVPSRDECKRIISAPKGELLSYFDISAAEVRTISYMSKDPIMIDLWEANKDLYVETALMVNPSLTIKEIKEYWRGKIICHLT